MDSFKDHFSDVSDEYDRFRPTYPEALVRYLATLVPETRTALDCGCGTGQLSVHLAGAFQRVIAIDASAEQITRATRHRRVEYRKAPAEDNGLESASVDLITAAQAAHWFDLDAFYAEVRRTLAPRGALVLVSYGVPALSDEVGEAFGDFYHRVAGPFWPPERQLVEDGYRDLPFPLREERAPPMAMAAEWSLPELIGYVSTWSAVSRARKQTGENLVNRLEEVLQPLWGAPTDPLKIRWPLNLRVGRVDEP